MLPGAQVSLSHGQQVFGALCHVRDLSVLPALTSAPASPWDEGSWVLAPLLGGDVCQGGFVPLP